MLLMKRIYFDAIRSGKKTTTFRYWRGPLLRPGSLHTVPGLGALRIDDVHRVAVSSLTLRDARADGFTTLSELKRTLKQLYPGAKNKSRKLYRVRFTFLGEQKP